MVALANDTEYGLAAYVCAQRIDTIFQLVRRLDFAMVSVNGVKFTGAPIPFGGMKASGLGREGGAEGFEPFVETKYFCLGNLGLPLTSACLTELRIFKEKHMTQLEQLFNEDRAHFMHPSTHAHDHASGALPGKIVTGAKGIRIEDHQGKSYIDAFAGLYCVNIGYGRTEVADAIYEQAKKLAYYHTYVGHSTDTIIELSSRIIDWSPAGMKKVYYGMSGSDANETQIKIVWYYNNVLGRPNKKKIISRQRGYHGSGIVTGSLTGLPSFHQHFDLPIDRVKHTVCPHWYRQAPAGMSEAQFSRIASRNWRS